MASITFSGQLDQAMNEAAAEGNKILFIPQQTVGEVLPGAASELVVESDGSYSITLAYNTYSIYHYSDVTKKRTLIANSVVVSADTAVSTIPDLIGSTVPVTEDSVLTIQGYLTEVTEAKDDAKASAEAAAESVSAIVSPWANNDDLAHEPSFDNFAKTDDMFIESYGQSLALGSQGTPVISTTQNYNNVMFASGVKRISGTDYSEFVDLVETLTGAYGETPVTSITNYLSENDDDYTSDGTRYIGSASGLGGQPIYNLNRGSDIYSYLMDRIQAAKALSDADGRSFSVPVIFWTQGENNINIGTDYRSYIESLTNLHSDLLEDVTSVTGQDYLPYMVTYQMGSHRSYGEDTPSIALAIKEVCDNTKGFGIACPLYSFEHYTDNVHLTNDSYYSLGQYYGKAAKDLMDYGEVQNCHIKSAACNGSTIMVDVNAPVPPLVIDTDNVAEAIGYGFYIKSISQGDDSSNNLIDMVTNVEVVNDTQLKITVDEEIPSDARLVYAHGAPSDSSTSGPATGPRGNIRDSQGDDWNWTTPTNGTYRRGDNWLLVDDVIIEHVSPSDLLEDFSGDVINAIKGVHEETPSLSVPFNESGRLDYGIGTEYVTGLPVYGVDFSRSTSCYYINKSGLVGFADVDEIAVGSDGAYFHGAFDCLNYYTNDITQAANPESATITTDGTKSPFAYTDEDASLVEFSSSGENRIGYFMQSYEGEITVIAIVKPVDSDSVILRSTNSLGNVIVSINKDGSYTDNSGSAASGYLMGVSVKSLNDGWYEFRMKLASETYSISYLYPVGTIAGSAYVAHFGVLTADVDGLLVVNDTGASTSVTATSCTAPINQNLPTQGESFTVVCDSYVDGSSIVNDYSNYYSIGTSTDYIGLSQSRAGVLRVQHSLGAWFAPSAEITGIISRLTLVCEPDVDAGTTDLSLYQDGELLSSQSFSATLGDITGGTVKFGASSSGTTSLNQPEKNFKILPYAASADEVESWGTPK